MPIVISLRKEFSSSVFRDAIIRALSAPGITRAYIASGFFEDFTRELQKYAGDFQFGPAMEGKQIYLFGGYDREKAEVDLLALRSALQAINLQVETRLPKQPSGDNEPELIWHAKIAVFLDKDGPVLAIVGSSNFTARSMYGPSEEYFVRSIQKVNVEADTYFWKKGCADASDVMDRALHAWGNPKRKRIAFDDSKFDEEVSILIEQACESILNFEWHEIP